MCAGKASRCYGSREVRLRKWTVQQADKFPSLFQDIIPRKAPKQCNLGEEHWLSLGGVEWRAGESWKISPRD